MKRTQILFLLLFLTNLLLAQSFSLLSWNIQDFGKSKSDEIINKIAKIANDYDVVALQEIVAIDPGGVQAVAKLADLLNRMGYSWDYRVSDPTSSPGKRMERYAFLWKKSKSKLIGRPILDKGNEHLVYREPYLAEFKIENKNVLIANYHSRSHKDLPEEEIVIFSDYQRRFDGKRIIIAGDFNMKTTEPIIRTLGKQGFQPNIKLEKTTLKRKCSTEGVYLNHPIDFILYDANLISLEKSGKIDFVRRCDNIDSARKISDHLPVWGNFYLR
jgi:endonuclease/exonuclease/phosphatase family metal-dependent hydrolase